MKKLGALIAGLVFTISFIYVADVAGYDTEESLDNGITDTSKDWEQLLLKAEEEAYNKCLPVCLEAAKDENYCKPHCRLYAKAAAQAKYEENVAVAGEILQWLGIGIAVGSGR